MPKPTTGRIQPAAPEPQPDPEQMATDTLMTSVFAGICLIGATFVLAVFGAMALYAGRAVGEVTGAKVGLGVGLALGTVVIAWFLRRFSGRIRARSNNLYRGAWIGTFASLAIIVVMAYAPWLMPNYCPPGGMC
jgi:hypothetical protein